MNAKEHILHLARIYLSKKTSKIASRRHSFIKQVFLPRVGVEFGYYFDFVARWLMQQENPNVLYLTYEDMVENLEREIERIAKFLNIELERDRVVEIVAGGSFAAMKQSGKFDYNWVTNGKSNFLRKGKVGDWVNYVSKEHSSELENLVQKHLAPLNARIRYVLEDKET